MILLISAQLAQARVAAAGSGEREAKRQRTAAAGAAQQPADPAAAAEQLFERQMWCVVPGLGAAVNQLGLHHLTMGIGAALYEQHPSEHAAHAGQWALGKEVVDGTAPFKVE